MPPAPPESDDAAHVPVFVDDTGRRHRVVRIVGWVLGGVTAAYLALLGISLVGSPGLVPLSLPALGRVLPGPAAPLVTGGSETGARPGDLLSGSTQGGAVASPTATGSAAAVPSTSRPSPAATNGAKRSAVRPTPHPMLSASPPPTAIKPSPRHWALNSRPATLNSPCGLPTSTSLARTS